VRRLTTAFLCCRVAKLLYFVAKDSSPTGGRTRDAYRRRITDTRRTGVITFYDPNAFISYIRTEGMSAPALSVNDRIRRLNGYCSGLTTHTHTHTEEETQTEANVLGYIQSLPAAVNE